MNEANGTTMVRALRPRVDRDGAVGAFTGGLGGAFRRATYGPVRSVAEVYVPFLPFEVVIRRPRGVERVVLGVDAVSATLDLYRFDAASSGDDLTHVRTRNHLKPVVSVSTAHDAIVARMQRLIYQRAGFLAAGRCHVEAAAAGDVISIPYWVGFLGRRQTASLVVMDGVRGQIEGAKVRRLIEGWLAG
jgi:hypothetical protein